MSARIQLSGFKELDEQLKMLSRGVARSALQRAGVEAMEPTARLARRLAPKETEELAESIDVGTVAQDDYAAVGGRAYSEAMRSGASKEQAVGALRDARRAVSGQRGHYYADVYMGPVAGRAKQDIIKGYVQEFGSMRVEPTPYLRPAFEQDKAAMMERLKKAIWFEVSLAIERAAKRGTLRG